MNTFLRSLLLAGGLVLAALPAGAQTVVFNSFGTGDIFNSYPCNAIKGSGAGTSYTTALGFTASSGGTLSSLELALLNTGGAQATVDVSFCGNAGGIPGAVLESWTGLSFTQTEGAIYTFAAQGAPVQLSTGSMYWIVARPGTSNSDAGWGSSTLASQGETRLYSANGGAYVENNTFRGAFRVTVSAIPEPSTYAALFGAAALGLVVWRRRAKR